MCLAGELPTPRPPLPPPLPRQGSPTKTPLSRDSSPAPGYTLLLGHALTLLKYLIIIIIIIIIISKCRIQKAANQHIERALCNASLWSSPQRSRTRKS
jgi:hypothetical protein